MLDSRRLRVALAVDAVGTALAGLLACARPGAASWLAPQVSPGDRTVRAAGVAVAVLGVSKGLLYAYALARHGGGTDREGPVDREMLRPDSGAGTGSEAPD